MRRLADASIHHLPELARFNLPELIDQFRQSILAELDLAGEARNAERIAANLIGKISAPLRAGSVEIQVGASVGIALYPEHADTAQALMRVADDAMYRVKHRGKNNFGFAAGGTSADDSPDPH